MSRFIFSLCVIPILFCHSLSFAQNKTWSLKDCIEYAYKNNIVLNQQKLTSEVIKINYQQAKANSLPNLNFSDAETFNFGNTIYAGGSQVINQNVTSNDPSLASSVVLFSGLKLRNLVKENKLNYDALVLPRGVMNPDKLRQNGDAVNFVKEFLRSGKPVAAICHGPQILIETGLLKDKTMTLFPSIRTDPRNAGVNWVDEEVVHFGNLITSRKPADIDAFNGELIKTLSLWK